jgi:hypothetical protein
VWHRNERWIIKAGDKIYAAALDVVQAVTLAAVIAASLKALLEAL